jgi:hypothetical protein
MVWRLAERATLAEAGAILGGERDSHTKRGEEGESDHAPSIDLCDALF